MTKEGIVYLNQGFQKKVEYDIPSLINNRQAFSYRKKKFLIQLTGRS